MSRSNRNRERLTEAQRLERICKEYQVPSKEELVRLILHPTAERFNELLDRTKAFIQRRAKKISTSQIRNIFARIKSAQQEQDLYRLRPLLAYAAGRATKEQEQDALSDLTVLMDTLIREVKTSEDVRRFQEFSEALVAYHRYFNPKES